MAAPAVERRTVDVDGVPLSYLTAGDESAPPLILLHGTFWSRVWQPVLPALAAQSRCYALDFPGFGRSGGELDVEQATVPALAQTVLQAADALGIAQFDVAAHDIGGGVAQQLAATSGRIRKMVLMNAVMFDSWPVPAVERFRDPEVRRNTTEEDLLAARRKSTQACALRTFTEDELEDYLSPWQSPARARSWMAMAAAADARFTLDLVPALKEAAIPTRLVWGRDDDFQKIEFARRYVKEVPNADLVEVDGRHIPTEDSPDAVADAMLDHLANGR
ncbi:alpha/beta fold hydrolase [Arthrobacter sp. SLBN-122]|uniref:alpha/beta fold hydrolase n=1 Tax=Arthrobacter sp. SLBN-122 TaxID=2768455 RepID=UPI0011526651|nr:alpha/beta hydrolase [Arthrobacter sp. SLBN-122]TQJ33671.1 pimeloyl-ACP methyl ester carboxylesterase [Arthrobacter sp. SLBN-122]